MTDFAETTWGLRLNASQRPELRLELQGDDTAGFIYVAGRFLATDAAASVLGLDTQPLEYTDHTSSTLAGLHLREYDYIGGNEPLPALVARLRTQARDDAPSAGVSPADCDVALHYAFTGNPAWIPHGHPNGQPSPQNVAAKSRSWPDGDPVVAVVDTGLDLASATGSPYVAAIAAAAAAAAPPTDGAAALVLDPDLDADALRVPEIERPHVLGAEAGHGTFITYLVGRQARDRVGLVNVRVLDADGVGTEASVLEGLRRLLDKHPGVDVLNLSFGGYTDATDYSGHDRTKHANPPDTMPLALAAWLREFRAARPDAVIVCAAGNYGIDRLFWPAASDDVLAVGSLNEDLQRSSFSNHGAWVDACTYGENLMGDYPRGIVIDDTGAEEHFSGDAARWSGTSFAAPVLAAEIAYRIQEKRLNGHACTAAEAWDDLKATLSTYSATPYQLGLVWDPRAIDPALDPHFI
ncbi:MAG: S8 family serine peptidase [Candidatus Nanopelagicales bacterium]